MLILSSAAAECGVGNTSPGETSAPPRTAYDASDVWLQFGDYVLGAVPEMFVTGPEIVVYSDGVVFAQIRGTVIDGRLPYDMGTGRLTPDEMRQLVTATKALPVPQPLSDTPVDDFALPLTFGGRTWQVPTWDTNEPAVQPVLSFIESLRETVRSAATTQWVPKLWIVRRYEATKCTVTQRPIEPLDYYETAIYPHLTERYSLGDFDCQS